MNDYILTTDGLTRKFGSLTAVDGVSLQIRRGARHAVIGPNGAGKTTLFALLAGTLRVTSGAIRLDEREMTKFSEPRRAASGLVRTMQHSSLFLEQTVLDNVLLAVQRHRGLAYRPYPRPRRDRDLAAAARTRLASVGLDHRAQVITGLLSHGERRQLEIAIALATEPRVLLLDEPAAGMSSAETLRLKNLILRLPGEITVLLVEHDLDMVFEVATEISVMHLGRHLVSGSPEMVRASAAVQAAYLGASGASPGLATDREDSIPRPSITSYQGGAV